MVPALAAGGAVASGAARAIDAIVESNASTTHRWRTAARCTLPEYHASSGRSRRCGARAERHAVRRPGYRTTRPRRGAARSARLLDPLRLVYTPNLLLVGAPEGEGANVTPLLADRPLIDGQPTAYVCERFLCQAPTTDPQELLTEIKALLPR
jgi:uncharacterized protein YyaL (SSP411 family)